MFMFRKKDTKVSTSAGLVKEAKKFQDAIYEINTGYKPTEINIALIEGVSAKYGVDVSIIASAFETYLKNNAITTIRKIKASTDYTVLHLEQAAESFGYDLATLNVTYFSKD